MNLVLFAAWLAATIIGLMYLTATFVRVISRFRAGSPSGSAFLALIFLAPVIYYADDAWRLL